MVTLLTLIIRFSFLKVFVVPVRRPQWPFRCERTASLDCSADRARRSRPRRRTVVSPFSHRAAQCARAYNDAMRRVGFIAMLAALAMWLAPAPLRAFCAAAEQGNAMSCCVTAQATLLAGCCSAGTAASIPAARNADSIAKRCAAEVRTPVGAAVQAIDGQLAGFAGVRLVRRIEPPAVLRT